MHLALHNAMHLSSPLSRLRATTRAPPFQYGRENGRPCCRLSAKALFIEDARMGERVARSCMSPRAAGGREASASQGGNHVTKLSPGMLRCPPASSLTLLRVPPSSGRGDMSTTRDSGRIDPCLRVFYVLAGVGFFASK